MRQIRLLEPKHVQTLEVEIPEIPQGWVLIRTLCCGICGTDAHSYEGETIFGKVFPFHIGHEVAGLIERTGTEHSPFHKGELVVINPFFTCGSCKACYQDQSNDCEHKTTIGLKGPGGFSEYILVPETSVYRAPQDINPARLCLAEPIANVIYAMQKLTVTHSMDVRINGAGAIGLIFLQLLLGCKPKSITVADFNHAKLERAKKIGADRVVDPSREQDGMLYQLIVDCTGLASCVEGAIHRLAFGGQLMSFGVCGADRVIQVSPFELYKRDATILSSFALNKSSMQRALDLLSSPRFDTDVLIDSVRPYSMLEQSLQEMAAGKTSGKVIIDTTRE